MNDIKYGVISDWVYIYRKYLPNRELNKLQFQMILQDNGKDYSETVNLYDCENIDDPNGIIAIPRYCDYGVELYRKNMLLLDNDLLA